MSITKARLLAEFIANSDVDSDEIATGAVTQSKLASTLDLSSKTITMPDVAAFNITSGDVGIGTASPTRRLEVFNSSSSMLAQFRSASGDDSFVCFANNSSNADQVRIGSRGSSLALSTNYTPRMTILTGGNVGIGTDSPTALLNVRSADTASLVDILRLDNPNAAGNGVSMSFLQNNGVKGRIKSYYNSSAQWSIGFDTEDTTNAMTIIDNGSVGIGTNIPLFTLGSGMEIQRNGTATLRLDSQAFATELRGKTDGTEIYQLSSGWLDFGTSNTRRMRITSAGKVGIGTTDPFRQVDVKGDGVIRLDAVSSTDPGIDFNTSGTNDMQFRYRGATDALAVYSYGTSSDVMTISKTTGKVGIGTGSPAGHLHVRNAAAGNGTYIHQDYAWTAATLGEFSNSAFTIRPRSSDIYLKTSGSTNDIRFQAINNANDTAKDIVLNPFGGNIGIGTVTPGTMLDVRGTIQVVNTNAKIQFTDASRTSAISTRNGGRDLDIAADTDIILNGTAGRVGIGEYYPEQLLHVEGKAQIGSSAYTDDAELFQETTNSRWSVFADDGADGWGVYKYGTNAGRAIFVDGNRDVAIGPTTPSYRLHVDKASGDVLYVSSSDTSDVTNNRLVHFRDNYSTTSSDGYVSAAWTSSPGQDVYIGKRTTSGAGYMAIKNSSGSEVFTINMSNGKVGIGLDPVPTARPWSKLWVEAPGIALDEISFEDNTSLSHFTLAGSNAHVRLHMGTMDTSPYGAWIQASYDNSPDNTGTGNTGTEPLLLNPRGGKVGIGEGNPGAQLHITCNANTTEPVRINDSNASGTTYKHRIAFLYQGTEKGSIKTNSAGTTYNTTSDRRLKENINPVSDGVEKIKAMNPITHTWKHVEESPTVHGFIAQEINEILPEVVTTSGVDDIMSMDYGKLTPVIVAALKDALHEIDMLKQRIEQLEAE